MSKHPKIHFFLFALLALLWSGSFINIKLVVDAFPPVFCAMIRVFLSLICLILFFILMRRPAFRLSLKFGYVWLAGLFTQAFPFALLFYGEKFIAPALASIINSTVSIWSLILGTIIFRDFSQWTAAKVVGILLGFIGITIIFMPYMHGHDSSMIGIMAIMGMAVCYAIGGLINQHIVFKTLKVNFETNILQQHIASVLFLCATSLSLETWPAWANVFTSRYVFAFLYLGVMATAIAWIIYFFLIREWGAVRATSVMYVVPMLAIIWDAVFLHIMPSPQEIMGMIAILIGVTLIQWVRKKPLSL